MINQNTKQYYHDCTVNKKSHLHLYNVHCMMIDAIKHGKYCPKFKSLCGVCKIEICELFLYFGQILVYYSVVHLQRDWGKQPQRLLTGSIRKA